MRKLSLMAAAAAVLAFAGMACGDEKPAAPAVKIDAPKAVEAPKAPEPVKVVDAPAPKKAPEVVAVPVNVQDGGSITGVVKVVDPRTIGRRPIRLACTSRWWRCSSPSPAALRRRVCLQPGKPMRALSLDGFSATQWAAERN